MNQKTNLFSLLINLTFVLVLNCGGDLGESQMENTETLCKDGIDNDEDGATDCQDIECAAFCTNSDSDSEPDGPIEADISGMPIPPVYDLSKPTGTAENLKILDWAGFKAAASYTFDDSQPSHIAHYDALQKTGVRMTFFASNGTAGASDFDTTWAKAVSDGHEIGNHTAHHCYANLTGCGFGTAAESAQQEIELCNDYIKEKFGQEEVRTMAAPFGDGGWSDIAKDYFFLNRGVNNGFIAPLGNSNPFNLPAKMAAGGETADDINKDLDSAYNRGSWIIYCFHSILPTTANWYAGVELDSITQSIEHTKSLKDMWVDTMANIGAYWIGQKVVSSVTPKISDGKTVWTWTLPKNFPSNKYLRITVDGGRLTQRGRELTWSDHGYYEISLDKGELTLSPNE